MELIQAFLQQCMDIRYVHIQNKPDFSPHGDMLICGCWAHRSHCGGPQNGGGFGSYFTSGNVKKKHTHLLCLCHPKMIVDIYMLTIPTHSSVHEAYKS